MLSLRKLLTYFSYHRFLSLTQLCVFQNDQGLLPIIKLFNLVHSSSFQQHHIYVSMLQFK